VPAVSVAGIGSAWGEPLAVAGAIVLLLVNIVCINLSAYLTFVALGYRSSVPDGVRESATLSLRTGAYAVIVVEFLVVTAATVVGAAQHLTFEQRANHEVQVVLGRDDYHALALEGVATEYDDGSVFSDEIAVTVTVGRSTDLEHPDLAERLRAAISGATGRSVQVDVRFVDYQRASAIGDDDPTWWPFEP
ncbi:MAG: TIGR00341 family protein, partial [Halolamina sp.]